jgi:hypothetical protein
MAPLSNGVASMPGFYSDLQLDPIYKELPNEIDQELLERRVISLRLGDTTQINPISVQLMRLVMSLVANFAHPKRTPDLIGVALLTLVESVRSAATKLEDNNIIPWVSAHVNRRLSDYIKDDHLVRIPGRTLRHSKRVIELYAHQVDNQLMQSKPDRPSLECMEILNMIVKSDIEKLYIELKSQGNILQLIADTAGVSIASIHKLKMDLRERFYTLYE